ncbi:MAG: glycosyltransferase family 4 protein [Phycisphaerales bacterium]|nr:glycosyltransferase family 4 protein [Phycisphaerales bacterium]MCB9863899.1 glycosyltransferase family 4 protein [Phycisphaerales bacterium]
MPVRSESTDAIQVILVADEDVVERFPGFIRYLQIGLIDEPIEFLLVAPDVPRTDGLIAGSTKLVRYRKLPKLFRGFAMRSVMADVKTALAAVNRKGTLLIHSLSLPSAPLAVQIAQGTGADLIINVASRAALNDPQLMQYLSQASELVTPVRAVEDAIHRSSLSEKAAQTVPFGVAAASEPAAFRKGDHATAILATGPLEPETGLDALIRAIAIVNREFKDLAAFIIGKGGYEGELRRLTNSLGLASNIMFTGRLEHLRSAMAAADVFCVPRTLPYFREEPIHAMALGLLLIIADDAIHDGLTHNRNAVLVPDGDDVAIAGAIIESVRNQENARKIAAAGQEHVRKNHSISGMVSRYQQIYEKVAAPRRTYALKSPQPSATRRV